MCKSSFLVKARAITPIITGGHVPPPQQFLEKVSKIVLKINGLFLSFEPSSLRIRVFLSSLFSLATDQKAQIDNCFVGIFATNF